MATNGADHTAMDTNSDGSDAERKPIVDDATQTFTPADRIRELIAIDAGVASIVKSAGLAVQALTQAAPAAPGQTSLEASKASYAKRANDYVLSSQSVIARLRRQIYALEEANIILPTRAPIEPQQAAVSTQQGINVRQGARMGAAARQEPPMQVTNGGLGKFDVGWLNSRIDRVGKQKEVELWAQAHSHLKRVVGDEEMENSIKDEGEMEVDQA